jgi:large exoprotein involved in heme utilization and adhesion
VQAGHVNLRNGGTINSASVAPATGNAGSVTITTTDQFESTGGNVTTSADNGAGGNITIQSNEILLNSGANVAASTTGTLDAGNIRLVAADRIMIQGGTVTSQASHASGGNITLLAPNLIRLRNGQIISSVQGGTGTSGGDITIDPQAVLIQNNSQILAQAFQGNGGNISITAGVLILEPGSLIDATSQLGVSGQVSVQAPIQSLAGIVNPLPQSFVSNANLYAQHCAANKGWQFSSFAQGSRDGIPPQPGEYLASPLVSDHASNEAPQPRSRIGADVLSARLGSPAFPLRGDSALRTVSGCKS